MIRLGAVGALGLAAGCSADTGLRLGDADAGDVPAGGDAGAAGALGLGLLGTDTNLNRLMTHTNASVYLCGHVHEPVRYWHNQTLMAQASTLGNPSDGTMGRDPGFNIVALDGGPVVKHVSLIDGPATPRVVWPVVMITTPVSPTQGIDLLLGGENPWAAPLPRGGTGQIVRAGVYSPSAIDSVTVRIDGGAELPMSDVGGYYSARINLPDADSCSIEVQAQSAGISGTDAIGVDLA